MPLKKSASKKAFSDNVKREMESGKKQKQAVAISYSVKRKAQEEKEMNDNEYISRFAEGESLSFKISKCYKAVEDLIAHKNYQIDENKKFENRLEKIDASTQEHFLSHHYLIEHAEEGVEKCFEGLDKCFERIGRIEKYLGKIIEQNHQFDKELKKILLLCESRTRYGI